MHLSPDTLRSRAEELRTVADGMKCLEAKRQLLKCAKEYEAWADKLMSLLPK